MMRTTKIVALGLAALSMFPAVSRAGDGVVALQTADPSCPDGSGDIYVDCGNGTVTDNRTGLVWLANADCLGTVDWFTAMEFVAGLKDIPDDSDASTHDCALSDGSSPGEWRLPSKAEWGDMIADAADMSCSPAITNDQGTGCWGPICVTAGFCAFSNVQSSLYWSATTSVSLPAVAWDGNLVVGAVGNAIKTNTFYVWPVRGGQ